jgi:hypothetical protein
VVKRLWRRFQLPRCASRSGERTIVKDGFR